MAWTVKTIHRGDLANPVAESNAIRYTIRKVMNNTAEAAVTLNDVHFASTQKYDAHETANNYLGGRLQIEDPTNTKIFDGCIVRVQGNPSDGTLQLFARDWLQQLDREEIVYDTREDLDGSGMRESYAKGDVDVFEGTGAGAAANRCSYGTDPYYFVDDNMSWDNDEWNGKYLLITNKSAGKQTVRCGPYTETVDPADAAMTTDDPGKGQTNVWVDDANKHSMSNDDDWTVDYYFYLGGDDSALVSDTTEVRVKWTWTLDETVQDGISNVYLSYYDWTGATWIYAANLFNRFAGDSLPDRETKTATITELYGTRMFSAGRVYIRFTIIEDPAKGSTNTMDLYFIEMEADIDGVADTSSYLIDDTFTTNKLELPDMTVNTGAGVYEGVRYCIVDVITSHLATLVGDYDGDVTLDYATDVTASTDLLSENFQYKTPLEILRRLAQADGTEFWLDEDLDLHWNDGYSTVGADAWTDATVIQWKDPRLTVKGIHNKIKVLGMIYEGDQVEDVDSDATSISYYGTYTKVERNPAIYTDKEASDLAASLKARYKEARYYVDAELNGLSSVVIGEVVKITSTHLDLTNAYYVVVEIQYDSSRGTTGVVLVPRDTLLNIPTALVDTLHEIKRDISHIGANVDYSPSHTETWS